MGNDSKSRRREGEIVTFYYLIFQNRMRKGLKRSTARSEACDAVTLRYGISRGRMLNIISERENFRYVNNRALQEKARELIDELDNANREMESFKEKNERLISILKECIDD